MGDIGVYQERYIMVRAIVASACLMLATADRALAQQYIMMGAGTQSCGQWVSYHTAGQITAYGNNEDSWLVGFLSGVGAMGKGSPLRGVDLAGLDLWVTNWCNAHPIAGIADAAVAFVEYHPR